jgi:hypothetical protein
VLQGSAVKVFLMVISPIPSKSLADRAIIVPTIITSLDQSMARTFAQTSVKHLSATSTTKSILHKSIYDLPLPRFTSSEG